MPDLHINMAIVDKGMKIVMVHDVGRNNSDQNAHVSIIGRLHGGAQVKVLDVAHHALSARCGHDTVEEQLGSDEVCSFGADITRVFDTITTDSLPDSMQDGLFRAMSTDGVEVGATVTMGNGGDRNEEHSVGSWDGCHALYQAVDLSGIGLLPQWAIRTVASLAYSASLPVSGLKALP